jgi:Uma2 family endonuclease
MAVQAQRMTVEEFDRFVELPQNADKRLEYIGGETVEVVSSQYASQIAARINGFIFIYLLHNNIGFLTGADGSYVVSSDERYIPDVAFVSKQRQAQVSNRPYSLIPPDLAVEVLSPSDNPRDVRLKVANYLNAGTMVWVVDPDQKLVEVYTPGKPAKPVDMDGTLDGGDVLPGFTLAVKDIFPA